MLHIKNISINIFFLIYVIFIRMNRKKIITKINK